MSPILLVVIGVAVVLGGILLVKLHPILALLLGALIVGLLTPDSLLESFAASKGLSPQQTQGLLNQSLGKRIALGFGDTCEKVGMLIVLASIILILATWLIGVGAP